MALAICPRRVPQKSRLVHHYNLLDWDGNGCRGLADLWQANQLWRTTYPGDPNDDGFLDIRDYLYINTDGCP
jgi:hypothetical protein